eukprot:UN04364
MRRTNKVVTVRRVSILLELAYLAAVSFQKVKEMGVNVLIKRISELLCGIGLTHFKDTFLSEDDELDIESIVKTKKRSKVAEKLYDLFEKYPKGIRMEEPPKKNGKKNKKKE